MTDELPAKTQASGKRGGLRSTSWKPGQSGNPAGAPKRGESWAEAIVRLSNMSGPEIVQHCLELAKSFETVEDGPSLKELIVLRAFSELLREPSAALLETLMSRAEGKPVQPLEVEPIDWREHARRNGLDPAELAAEMRRMLEEAGY